MVPFAPVTSGHAPAAASRSARPSVGRRAWSAPLWAHASAFAVLLAALLPVMSPDSSFTTDEGAYALQVQALARGSWAYDYRAAALDPERESFPVVLSNRRGDTFYPYVKHPAYPMLLRGAEAVAGQTMGLHLLGLLGAVGTAVAAWLLAGEVDPRLRRPAFWLAAVSPVLVNGYLLWAHAPSAAVAGLTITAAVRVLRHGPTAGRMFALGAGAAAGVLLRSEGLLLAAALAAGMAVAAWRDRRRIGPSLGASAMVLAAALAAAAVERAWVGSIAGGAYDSLHARAEGVDYLAGRWSAAWHDLFHSTDVGVIAFVVLVGFSVVALRRWNAHSLVTVGVGTTAACALLLLQWLKYPEEATPGLFAAWPVALVGLLLLPWRSYTSTVRWLGATCGVFGLAVLATEYAVGGGLQHGGRFFFPLLAPLAVLATIGLDHRLARAGARRAVATAWVVLASVAVAVAGMAAVATVRATHDRIAAAVARHPAAVTVTTVPSLPRVAWRVDGRVTWMLTEARHLATRLADLRERGVGNVAVVTAGDVPRARLGSYRAVVEVDEPALVDRGLALFLLRA